MSKLEAAKKAIEDVFSDTSMSPEKTYEALMELREEVTQCLACLKEDGVGD